MEFTWQGQTQILHGVKHHKIEDATSSEALKYLYPRNLIFAICMPSHVDPTSNQLPLDMEQI